MRRMRKARNFPKAARPGRYRRFAYRATEKSLQPLRRSGRMKDGAQDTFPSAGGVQRRLRGSGCPQGLGKAPGKQEGDSTPSLFSSAGGGICVAEERQNAAFAIMLWPQNEASLISILSDRRRPEEAEQGRGGQEGPRAASGGLLRRLRPQPLRRLCQARGRQGEVRVRRSDRRPAEGGGPKAPLRKQDCHRINHLRRPPSVFPGRRRAFSNRIDKSLIKTIWHF